MENNKGLRSDKTSQPFDFLMVREMGLEPTLLSELEPKSNASASSATLARKVFYDLITDKSL